MWPDSVPGWKGWSTKFLLLQKLLQTVAITMRGCNRYALLVQLSLADNDKSITWHNTISGIFKNIFTQDDRGTESEYSIHIMKWLTIGRSECVYTLQIISRSTARWSLWATKSIVNPPSFHKGRACCKILVNHCLPFVSVLFNENTNTKNWILQYWRA